MLAGNQSLTLEVLGRPRLDNNHSGQREVERGVYETAAEAALTLRRPSR